MPILGIIASQNYPRITNSYESIATTTVGGGGSSTITFSSIPATFTHLQLRWIGQDNRGATNDGVKVSLNSNTTNADYAYHRLWGNGSSAQSFGTGSSFAGIGFIRGDTGNSIFGVSILDFLDYANTNKYKTVRVLGGNDTNGAGEVGIWSMLWMKTDAINSLTLTPENGSTFSQYSHFALYGIKGA